MSKMTGHSLIKTLVAKATTTVTLNTTNDSTSSVFSTDGYRVGITMVNVTANASGDPYVVLQGAMNTTNWVNIATIHPDLTTTANTSYYTSVGPDFGGPMYAFVRSKLIHSSTSTSVLYTVKLQLNT